MEGLQRAAVVFSLIDALSAAGSWCGETHIQKATYFLQEMLDVQLGYDFITELKPHVSMDDAIRAVNEVDTFHRDTQSLLSVSVR